MGGRVAADRADPRPHDTAAHAAGGAADCRCGPGHARVLGGSTRRTCIDPAMGRRPASGHQRADLHLRRDRRLRLARRVPSDTGSLARPAARELPAGGADRRRRHGRGVARPSPAARAPGGHQAHQARHPQRAGSGVIPRDAPPLRARGAGDRCSALAAHGGALRLRHRAGRHVLLRDGDARRLRSENAGRAVRPGAGIARDPSAGTGLSLAGGRAPVGSGAPRRQALEYLHLPARSRPRLREGATTSAS